MKPRVGGHVLRALLLSCLVALLPTADAQIDSNERAFPQSKATVEKALKAMQVSLAGRLPVLDGFALPDHPLDRYQRGYYQATAQVTAVPAGGSVVRISVKVTAWLSDPVGPKSGYQLLNSNGRLEADLLDQLGEQLAKVAVAGDKAESPAEPAIAKAPAETDTGEKKADSAPPKVSVENHNRATKTVSAMNAPPPAATSAQPAAQPNDNPAPSALEPDRNFSAALKQNREENHSIPPPSDNAATKNDQQLQAELEGLQEVLKNQVHPKNLVAVKKAGTSVVDSPSLNAKPLFLASKYDEFEMLDFNEDWVHVRISGLSRGWIWRNSLEMPEGIPDTATRPASAPSLAADLFHVTREETATFPGDWQPLRGKNVKIISVQKVDEKHQEGDPQEKLAYAKYLLDKTYTDMRGKPQDLAGIVLIFDSVDGGMIAATLSTLEHWKAGTVSDAALWHECFFDPPETFTSTGSSGTR
jgi:hypothetical protein